tara:strand:- start:823 stop:2049 length:1227 start_codon:yes stop_codon:yes gene_type:complete
MEARINDALAQASNGLSDKLADIDAAKAAHKTAEDMIDEGKNALTPIIGGDAATLAGIAAKYGYNKYMKPNINTAVDKGKSLIRPNSSADTNLSRINRNTTGNATADEARNAGGRESRIQVVDDEGNEISRTASLQRSQQRLANLRLGDAQRAQGRGRATLGDEAAPRDEVRPTDYDDENPFSFRAFEQGPGGGGTPGERLGEIFRQGDAAVSQPSTGLGDLRQSAATVDSQRGVGETDLDAAQRGASVSERVAGEEARGASLSGARQLPTSGERSGVLDDYARTATQPPPSARTQGVRSGARTSARGEGGQGNVAPAEEEAETGAGDIAKTEASLLPAEEAESAVPGIGDIIAGITAIGGLISGAVAEGKTDEAAKAQASRPVPQLSYYSAPQQDTSDMAVGGGFAS